jgi:hypothetical protein
VCQAPLNVILGALLLAVVRANAAIMLNDDPLDIKAKWGPMTARAKRQRWLAAAFPRRDSRDRRMVPPGAPCIRGARADVRIRVCGTS